MTDNRQQRERGLAQHLHPCIAGLAVAALAVVPACGDNDSGDGDDAASTTAEDPSETASTTTPPTPEEEAEAVYLEFVEVVERLLTVDPDPDDPDLARVAVDPVLTDIRDGTTTQQAENQLWELGDRTSHTIGEVTAAGDQVLLRDCLVENDVLVDQDDGRVVETTPLATRDLEVAIVRTDEGWAVSEITTTRTFEGEETCA